MLFIGQTQLCLLPIGGQKVSFAGGVDDLGDGLKPLAESEIPEDAEGAGAEDQEPEMEQDNPPASGNIPSQRSRDGGGGEGC